MQRFSFEPLAHLPIRIGRALVVVALTKRKWAFSAEASVLFEGSVVIADILLIPGREERPETRV